MAERRAPRTGRLTTAVILLAFGSGAVDALSFAGLGSVFASVMTGNLIVLGVAVVHAHLDAVLAASSAIIAYVAGVLTASLWLRSRRRPAAAGADRGRARRRPPSALAARPAPARIGGTRPLRSRRPGSGLPRPSGTRGGALGDPYDSRRATPACRTRRTGRAWRRGSGSTSIARVGRRRTGRQRPAAAGARHPRDPWAVPSGGERMDWPERVRAVLAVVPVAQAAVLAGWLLSGDRPGVAARTGLLALAAFAMGVQSAGVNTLPLRGAATTYLTGTLTTLTTELATSGVPATVRLRFAVLAAALAGAALDAALLGWARPAAPALPLAATLTVVLILARRRRGLPHESRPHGRGTRR